LAGRLGRGVARPRERPEHRGDAADWAAWRFGDTLTFAVRTSDLLGAGLRLRLRVQSDVVCLGPLQVQLPHRAQDYGEAVVDLRSRVLPASVPAWSPHQFFGGSECEFECPPAWETPALVFPLARVNDSPLSGVEVSTLARVALSFSVNADPTVLLREAEQFEMPLTYKVADGLLSCMHAPLAPLAACSDAGRGDAEPWGGGAWGGCADGEVTPRRPRRRAPLPGGAKPEPVLPAADVRMV